MAFHDDLLQQAFQLVHNEPTDPNQASLRRAVSPAYYALFHLLINEAVANWSRENLRQALGRAFDHGLMKNASNRILNSRQFPFTGEDPLVVNKIRTVAETFARLQEKRHTADYNGTVFWSRIDALEEVNRAKQAFADWHAIRNEQIAQAYLVSLLVKHRD